jgi:hypothetical protein
MPPAASSPVVSIAPTASQRAPPEAAWNRATWPGCAGGGGRHPELQAQPATISHRALDLNKAFASDIIVKIICKI